MNPELNSAAWPYALGMLVFVFLQGVCLWRVAKQAGYSPWIGLIALIPIVNFIVFVLFAFATWPALATQRRPRGEAGVEYDESTIEQVGFAKRVTSSLEDHSSLAVGDDWAYEAVAAELDKGQRSEGLWLKAELLASGDLQRQRIEYVRLRIQALTQSSQKQERVMNGNSDAATKLHLSPELSESLVALRNAGYIVESEGGLRWKVVGPGTLTRFFSSSQELLEQASLLLSKVAR